MNNIKGGLSDTKTISDIANSHNVSVDDIKVELRKGMRVEMEHTDDKHIAIEIAMDHLMEDPKYYTKLVTIEKPKMKNESKIIMIPNGVKAEIIKSINMGYDEIKVGMISPKRKGIMLVNDKYQVRGTYPLELQATIQSMINKIASESVTESKINWKDFYTQAKDTSGRTLKSFEKKYGEYATYVPVSDALKKSKDFNSFMRMVSKFESTVSNIRNIIREELKRML